MFVLMKRITIIALMVTGFTIGTLSSCSKDETSSSSKTTTTDARDLAVGTYSGYSMVVFDGQTSSDTTSITVTKGPNKTLLINGNTVTSDVVVNGSDLSGNIPAQNIKDEDGNTTGIEGEGASNKQFSFVASSKTLFFSVKFTDGPLRTARLTFSGVKK